MRRLSFIRIDTIVECKIDCVFIKLNNLSAPKHKKFTRSLSQAVKHF